MLKIIKNKEYSIHTNTDVLKFNIYANIDQTEATWWQLCDLDLD